MSRYFWSEFNFFGDKKCYCGTLNSFRADQIIFEAIVVFERFEKAYSLMDGILHKVKINKSQIKT